ncbi:uridine kinase family protein [Caryophanon tenue]|nr:hypothetical protein [Caryophanon tenue]
MMDLLQRLAACKDEQQHALIIGIDGGSGAGKTTLAEQIEQALPNVTVISTNDFIMPLSQQQDRSQQIGQEMDWQRLKKQVLIPLAHHKQAKYWCYDVTEPMQQRWNVVEPYGIVIVGGIYSTRLELAPYYDIKIWVSTPAHIRLARNIEKDGEHLRTFWEQEQLPAEQRYIEEHLPHKYAEMILDGQTGAVTSRI